VVGIGLAVLAGLLGNLGIQLLAPAYAEAEAQALGVLEFTALPWAAFFEERRHVACRIRRTRSAP
jgi:hypothetical protein